MAWPDHVNAAQDYVSTLKELVDERSLYVVNMYSGRTLMTTTDGFKSKVPRRYRPAERYSCRRQN